MSTIKKNLGLTTIVVVIAGGGFGIYQISRPAPTPTPAPTVASKPINPLTTAISEIAAQKAVLVDVRTPAEFAESHAQGAINFDSVNVEAGQLPEIAKDAKIYLYCHSGRRASIVLSIMRQAGYTNVTNLGAFQSWVDAGGPKA